MKTIHNSGVDVLAGGTLTRVALLNTALTFSVFIRGEWGWGGDREEHLSTFDPIHHTIQKRTQNDRRRQVVFLDATRVVCMSASARMRVLFMWKKEKTTAIFDGLSVYDEQSSVLYACTLSTHTHTDTIQSNRVFGGLFLSIKHTHIHTHTTTMRMSEEFSFYLSFQLTHKFRTRRIFRTVRRICFRSLSIRGFLWSLNLLTKLNYPFIQFLAGERRFIRICLTLCLRYWSVSVEHSDYTHT